MKSFEKLYYSLFSIPKPRVMLAISILATALLAIFERRVALVWIATTISAAVAKKILKLKFDLKRVAFFALFISILSLPGLIFFRSPVTSYIFYIAVMYFCSEAGFLGAFILSAATYMILDPTLVTLVVVLILSALFYVYLSILNIQVGKINIREFVEQFVLFWLTSDPKYMEDFFRGISGIFKGKVRCLSFGSAKLVSTDFHPGPFRNVGGAKLVEMISCGDAAYLHSPTSHARNPVTQDDVEKIVRAVRCGGSKLKARKPFRITGSKFEVHCFPFNSTKLIMVSGKEAIDDFSVRCKHFVVDCHNAYRPSWDVSEEEEGEIKKLIEKATKTESEECELKYGFVKINAETDSICNYVAALLLDYNTEKYAIVVFDSNNIKVDFRRYVEREFDKIGYKAIVVSTDNHAKTGIRAKVSYKPAGSCSDDWKLVNELIEQCKNVELKNAECSFAENEVEVRVMGEEFLRDSEIAASKYAAKLIAIFLALAVVGFILPSLIFIWR